MRYQTKRPKRQFLAGVACPKCQCTDAIVRVQIFEPKEDEYIECTECDHIERRPAPQAIRQKNAALDAQTATGISGIIKFFP